jgi:Icc-related predicted phosphoesterase
MRALVASDLHFEFHKDEGESFVASMPEADVLVCAGDLANAALIEKGLRLLCDKFPEVVYVAGNHEFYGSSIGVVRRRLEHLDRGIGNLHYLDNKVVEIDGQRFAGTTMWFREKPNIGRLHRHLNDFHHIADATHKVYEENVKALEFLEAEADNKTIVVTHHMPSDFCVDKMYEGSPINCFFVCDMDELICEKQPPVWIHGHTHCSVDTTLDQTRLLCNPFGYAGYEVNPAYLEDMILEL